MAEGQIRRQDIITDDALQFGTEYAKNVQTAIDKNDELKKSAQGLFEVYKQLKSVSNQGDFKAVQTQRIQITNQATKAYQEQGKALAKVDEERQRSLRNLLTTTNRIQNSNTTTRKQEIEARENYRLQTLEIKRNLTAMGSLIQKRDQARKSVQEFLALQAQGKKLSDQEQRELKQSRVEFEKYNKAVNTIKKSTGQFQENVGNYPKLIGGVVTAFRQLIPVLGIVGGIQAGFRVIGNATRTIIDFDKQLIAVQKTTNLTDEEIKEFRKNVIQLGIELEGISTQNLLKASEVAGQLGIKGTKNILKFAETIEKLALTSDISGEESSRQFARFIEISSDSVENADRLGSVITELGNNFATTESQVLKNTTEIQKGISIYNTSAQSVLGLGAATSALGSEAEASRGALQTAFKILNEGATTGKNLEKILALTGQTAKEFRKEFAEDSVETFRRFIQGLSESDKQGKNLSNTLGELGLDQKRVEAVVGTLAKNYNVLEDALTRANDEYETNSALNAEAEKSAQSLSSKIGDLDDAWENLVLTIETGQGKIATSFKQFVGFITDLVNRTNELEQAQSRVFELTGKDGPSAFRKFLNGAVPGLFLLDSKYDSLVELQEKFNDANRNIDANGILTLQNMYNGLNKELETNKGLSEEEIKLYEEQKKVVQDAINTKKEERKSLEETAIALGFNEKELGNYSDKIQDYTDGDLQDFINANQEAKKTIDDLTDAERKRQSLADKKKAKQDDQDNFNLQKQRLEQIIDAEQDIVNNEEETFGKRISANLDYFIQKQNLLILEKDFALKNAQGRTDEITRIEEKFNQDIIDLQEERDTKTNELLENSFQKTLKRLKDQKELEEKAINERIQIEQDALNRDLQGLNGQAKLDRIQAYEDAVTEIRREAALERLKIQIDAIEAELNNPNLDPEQRLALEELLKDAQIAYSNQVTENAISNAEKEQQALQRLYDFKQSIIRNASQSIADSLNIDAQNIEVLFSSFLNKAETTGDAVIDKYNQVANTMAQIGAVGAVAGDVLNSVFEANIERIDEQIEASEEFYNRQYELAQGDADQQEAIRLEQEAKKKILEDKKRKEQEKAAKFAKAFSIFNIGITTAQAAIAALAPPPIGLGPILGVPLATLAIAFGALQIGAVLAKPIPKYQHGTEHHKGGPAEVAEVRPEVIQQPGQKPFIQRKRAVLNLARGTKVYSSIEDFEKMKRAAIMSSIQIQQHNLNEYQSAINFDQNYGEVVDKLDEVNKSVKGLKLSTNIYSKRIDIDHDIFRYNNIN